MTQRERTAEVYETPQQTLRTETPVVTNTNVDVVTPADRVRWGSVLAGLFAALSTLAVLSLLGLAIGASTFDPGDSGRNFGIGAGLWSALSALIAFGVGGWVAARTAAMPGRNNGLLNGTMVWVVAIPLLLYALSNGIGAIGRAAATTAEVVAPAAGAAAGEAAEDPALQATVQAGAQDATGAVQATAEALQSEIADPANQEAVANGVKNAAWGTLGSLLAGLLAAAIGGYLGSRERDELRPMTSTRPSTV